MTREEHYEKVREDTSNTLGTQDRLEGFYAAMLLYLLKKKNLSAVRASRVMLVARTEDSLILGEAMSRSMENQARLLYRYISWKLGEGEIPEQIEYALKKIAMMEGRSW